MRKLKFLIILILGFFSLCFADESITLTTYYPSPYGTYNQLQSNQLSVGDTNGDSQMTSADLPPANGQIYAARSVIYKPQDGTPSSSAVTGELVYNTNDSRFYYYDGSAWVKLGGGWYVPTDVKLTTTTHNGNFGGYQAMYTWIQANGCPGYHVCSAGDLVSFYQFHPLDKSNGARAWYNSGVFLAWTGYPGNDCFGWSDQSHSAFGSLWGGATLPTVEWCDDPWPVYCCK